MEERILIVDDERSIADLIAYAFEKEGYMVDTAYEGEEALAKVQSFSPDVLIIDVMMPKMDGFEVCRRLNNIKGLGILMLTAKNDMSDKISGLEVADDYITKPFDIRELIARTKSLLRRLGGGLSEKEEFDIVAGDLKVKVVQRKVLVRDRELDLTPKEFDLLVLLFSNMERVYTREQLLDLIWGMEYFGGTRTVDIHIQRIRKKLEHPYDGILQTVYRVGYKAVGKIYE